MSWPSPARAWWAVAVFCATAVLSYADRQVLSLLVDPIRTDLGLNDTQISLLLGLAFALIYSFAGLPLGRLADMYPRKWLVVSGVLVWSAATMACGLAESFAGLFAARVILGIGEATLAPAAMSMIADYFPPQRRGLATGTFLMGMTAGSGVAIAIGGLILEMANAGTFDAIPLLGNLPPWRMVLVLLGMPGIVVALLLISVREPTRQGLATASETTTMRTVLAGLRRQRAILLPIYLALAIRSIGDIAVAYWTPSLLSRRFASEPGEIGVTLGAISIIAGIAGTLGGGWIADRALLRLGPSGRLTSTTVAMSLATIAALIGFADTPVVVFACFGLWTLMSTAAGAIAITTLQDVLPGEFRGFGIALASFGNILIGLGVGATLTAMITEHVYRDPLAVAQSIGTVLFPAGLISVALFHLASRRLLVTNHGAAR